MRLLSKRVTALGAAVKSASCVGRSSKAVGSRHRGARVEGCKVMICEVKTYAEAGTNESRDHKRSLLTGTSWGGPPAFAPG